MRFWAKLLILAVGLGGAVKLYQWRRDAERTGAWAEFLALEDTDVQTLEGGAGERARALFERFAASNEPGAEPWAVVRLDPQEPGESVVALRTLEGPALHATILDAAGGLRGASTSPLGAAPSAVKRAHRFEAGGWCLELEVEDGEPLRMSYAVRGGGLVLLRVEGADGEIRPRPAGSFGQGPPARQPLDWTYPLRSDDPAEVLEALGWLGARVETEEGEPDPYPQLGRARADRQVQARLRDLRESQNDWIREAAEFASAP